MKSIGLMGLMLAVVVYGLTVAIAVDQVRTRDKELVELRGKVSNLTKAVRLLAKGDDRAQEYLGMALESSEKRMKLEGEKAMESFKKNAELAK